METQAGGAPEIPVGGTRYLRSRKSAGALVRGRVPLTRDELRDALHAWGRWEAAPAVEWLPAELGYPSATAEASAGQGRRSRRDARVQSLRPVAVIPPPLVEKVRRSVQGMPRHELGALRRRYVPGTPPRPQPTRFAERREARLLARAERTVGLQLAQMG